MRLPIELRLVIWNLSITPRILHYCYAAAKRIKLQLDHVVPPVLHTCQESRAVGLEIYALGQLATRRLYLSHELDTLLWIRYNRYNGPHTFSADARKFLHGNTEFSVQNFAISPHYWSSIISKDPELYIKIRTGVSFKWLTIVDEIKTWTNWTRLSGAELKLARLFEKSSGDHAQVVDVLILRLCFFKSITTIRMSVRTSADRRDFSDFLLYSLSIHLRALLFQRPLQFPSTSSLVPESNTTILVQKHHLRNHHGVEAPKQCGRQLHLNFKSKASPLEHRQYHEDFPLLAAAVLGRDD
jgi:hypothetical protein